MRRTTRLFVSKNLLLLLLAASLIAATACEDEGTDVVKANCGDWVYNLTKQFESDQLVACTGRFTPSCYLNDGTLVNDENIGTELTWEFTLSDDLNLLSVEWSMWGTTNTVVIEADVVDGMCGEGTIAFIVSDGENLDGCDAIEVTEVYWDAAGEVHN